jgi:hypothetical protein
MNIIVGKIKWLVAISLLLSVVACSDNAELGNTSLTSEKLTERVKLDVYKSKTCGCCKKWVTHVGGLGFDAEVHHPADMNTIKIDNGILPRYRSCHTAISKGGYVFEGHVPGDIIQKFLADPPQNAIGLAAPGMPVGSPGMEVGNRFDPYDVLLLKSDGTSVTYAHIEDR